MRTIVAIIVAGFLYPLSHAASSERPAGAQIAAEHCSTCHAIGRRGASPNPAAPVFRELEQNYGLEELKEKLQEGTLIATHPDMLSFKLPPDHARALFDYLRSIQE
jgi:cytochrome c